jgi:hypothetical protein
VEFLCSRHNTRILTKERVQTTRRKAEKAIHLPARMKPVRGRGKYNSSDKTMARKRKVKKN